MGKLSKTELLQARLEIALQNAELWRGRCQEAQEHVKFKTSTYWHELETIRLLAYEAKMILCKKFHLCWYCLGTKRNKNHKCPELT